MFNHMLTKYLFDPEWVERNLPEVAQIISRTVSPPARIAQSPFGLTERERAFRIESLPGVDRLDELAAQDAIKALEHVAALILDDSLPWEYNHQAHVRLFKAAFNKSPSSFRTNTVIPVSQEDGGDEPAHRAPLVRGVAMNLDLGMNLLSVTVTPRKVKEREKLMSIVGIVSDSKTDVAARHDDYLAEQSPHAAP